jgi:phosphoribosylaminoimidazolecarboxamide formyltransferase/IMP cyclohydrolase
VQSRDNGAVAPEAFKLVTARAPTERQLRDMLFAWTIVRHVKSNAIVFARDGVTAGIGAGQVNRRDSRASPRSGARGGRDGRLGASATIGSAMASEAFLPFADALEAAIEAGATAVIQPGGALRDDEVIARADDAGIAMVFTGMRHFRH